VAATVTVTADEIDRAGKALLAANRAVSGYSLRVELGNRGDPRRLIAVWEQARQGGAAPADQPEALVTLPPDLDAQATALCDQLAAGVRAAITGAWTAAERRAAERLRAEAAQARAAAESARLAQSEADEALAATDAAMTVLTAERDQAVAATDRASSALAQTTGERNAIAAELATARAALTEAECRAAAAEAARETALAAARQTRDEARAATAAATAVREQAVADVATARAEAAAARAAVEEMRRAAGADTLGPEAAAAGPRPSYSQTGRQARAAAAARGRPARHLDAAKPAVAAPLPVSDNVVPPEPAEARPDDLPIVADRLKIPKAERAAYDDGRAAGMNGWDEKVPKRFQPGQRLAHLLPYRRAGYRDGAAGRQARAAPLEAASEARGAPGGVSRPEELIIDQ